MKRTCLFFLVTLVVLLRSQVDAGEAPVVSDRVAIHELHGVLQSYDPQTRQATISHDEIPGYMPAMMMSFAVSQPAELSALQPGDPLSCHLCVTKDRAWIEQVQKVGPGSAPLLAPAPPDLSRELKVGDLLPDIALVDDLGKTFHLHDFRGQALILTFIYTQCPLPTYCPLVSRNFASAQELLSRLGAGDNWHLLSISLDAAHDTPGILAAYAQSYQADARHWSFATAREEELRQLATAVGLTYNRVGDKIDHTLRTVVVDTHGRIAHLFRGNRWTPQELVAESRTAMRTR